jgi:hypothetical protein
MLSPCTTPAGMKTTLALRALSAFLPTRSSKPPRNTSER